MDNFVYKTSVLPEITFGDFSEQELSQFFRSKGEAVASNAHDCFKMADDGNPFIELATRDSSGSITDQVNDLRITRSSSFPELSTKPIYRYKYYNSNFSADKFHVNKNKNNPAPGTSKEYPGASGSKDENPFDFVQPADDMEVDEPKQVGLNDKSIIESPKISKKDSKIRSRLATPLGSPMLTRRLTRSSSQSKTHEHNGPPSGVILKSKSNAKCVQSKNSDQLKQNLDNIFKLNDLDLSELVSSQSESNILKLTIRRQSTGNLPRSVSATNLGPNLDPKSSTPVCLQNKPVVNKPVVKPQVQRANNNSPRPPPETHESNSGASGNNSHVDLGQGSSETLFVTPSIANPNINLNARLPLQSPRDTDDLKQHQQQLLNLRASADMVSFSISPQPSTSDSKNVLNLSQQLTVRFTDNSRHVSSKNQKLSKEMYTWDFYRKTMHINPFTMPEDPTVQDPKNPKNQENSKNMPKNKSRTKSILGLPNFSDQPSESNLLPNSDNSSTPQGKRQEKVFGPAEAMLEDYASSLIKEMSLRLHVNMLTVQIDKNLFPNWIAVYNPPPNLVTTQEKANELVEFRRYIAIQMMNTNLELYQKSLDETVSNNGDTVRSLQAIYATPAADDYSLKFALDQATETATLEKAKKFKELSKIMMAIVAAPEAALWKGISGEFERPSRAIKQQNNAPGQSNSPNFKNQGQKKQNQNNQNFQKQNKSPNPNPGPAGTHQPRPPTKSGNYNNKKNFRNDRSQSARGTKRRRDDLAYRLTNAIVGAVKEII